MKFTNFLKDKFISIFLLIFILCTIEIFLMIYNFGTFIKIYIMISIALVYY